LFFAKSNKKSDESFVLVVFCQCHFFETLNFDIFFVAKGRSREKGVLFSLPSWSSCFRARFYSPSLWKMKDETKRARVRAQSFEGGKRKEKKTIDPRGKNAMMEKNFLLAVIQSREGEDSSWRRFVVVISSSLKNKISLPKRTFAVSHLRVGDGGSLLLLGDNLGDDLGAGDLGL
jgi:IS4 transposase